MESSKIYKKEKIRLKFSLENCDENTIYSINFKFLDNDDFEDPIQTEEIKNIIKNGSIKFKKVIMCEYDFSQICLIKINVEKKRDSHYSNISIMEKCHLALSTIIAKKNSTLKTKVRDFTNECETLIVEAENPTYSEKDSNFFDYLKAGINFDSYILIDFSGGQEHISDLRNNQFMQVIKGFRETLYDFVQSFKVYGYGGKLNNDESGENNNKYYFNLITEKNPENVRYTKIREKYKELLGKITFEQRGYLSPLFEKIRKDVLDIYSPEIYNIIFILINNKPNDDDIQKCIDLQIETAYLPISYIVIFIGNKSDEEIKEIRSIFSNKKKYSSRSIERTRNNMSFFTLKNYNYNNEVLKNKCLREIPEQITYFYTKNITYPEDIKKKNLEKIKKSYREFPPNPSLFEDDFGAPPSIINSINEQKEENEIEIKQKNDNKIINDNYNNKNEKEKYYDKPVEKEIKKNINVENPFKNKYKGNNNNIINLDVLQEKENNKEIKKENNFFNVKDCVNETPDPNKQKEEEKEIKEIKKKPNSFNKKDYIYDTPNPDDKKEVKNGEKKLNPFAQKYGKGVDEMNEMKIEKNNIGDNEKKIINIINDPKIKGDEKNYINSTPNPDDNNNKEKKNIPNPFAKKNKIKEKEVKEEKLTNATPGNENNENQKIPLSNPFLKRLEGKKEQNVNKIEEDKNKKEKEQKENKIEEDKNKKEKEQKEIPKKKKAMGSHFKKRFEVSNSKISTSSNSVGPEKEDYNAD